MLMNHTLSILLCTSVLAASGCASTSTAGPEPVAAETASLRLGRFRVVRGDTKRLAHAISDALELRGPTPNGHVRAVLSEPSRDEILVLGTQVGIDRVGRLLESVREPAPAADDVQTIRLSHSDARDIAPAVAQAAPRDVRVITVPRRDLLLIRGSEQDRAMVAALVRELDSPEASAQRAPVTKGVDVQPAGAPR